MDVLSDVERESKSSKKVKKGKKEKKQKMYRSDEPGKGKKRQSVDDNQDGEQGNKRRKITDDPEPDTFSKRLRTRSMSEAEEANRIDPNQSAEDFRKTHSITISGLHSSGSGHYIAPAPMTTFDATPFAPSIRKALDAAGFPNPTPTQAQSWPIALSGRDIITVAKTGSGKTCGFLLPAFHLLLDVFQKGRRRGAPAVVVIAPTRELVCQIDEEAKKFGKSSNIRSACLYGGDARKWDKIKQIQAGVEVLICTPGRLNDLLERGAVDLSQVLFLVLDEADRMLDMGFEPQIRIIISKIPLERQSLFFTATWPREVQTLAKEFLKTPVELKFGDVNSLNANKAIVQRVMVVSEHEKSDKLKEVLKEINPSAVPAQVPKCIIFVSRKSACDYLGNYLWGVGYAVGAMHGDMLQPQREKVMNDFKTGKLRVLVATDVAGRGLDVKDIAVVINYDFPVGMNGVEDYVHRIGRTARGNNEGRAFTFFTVGDAKRATQLIGVLKRAEQIVPVELQRFDRSGARSLSRGGRGGRFGGFGGRVGHKGGRGGRGDVGRGGGSYFRSGEQRKW